MSNNDSPLSRTHGDDDEGCGRNRQDGDAAETARMAVESTRQEAESLRAYREEARELSERVRQELESARQENEARRNSAEQSRQTAEARRDKAMESVAATAEALRVNLMQMQFLLDAQNVYRDIQGKPTDDDR